MFKKLAVALSLAACMMFSAPQADAAHQYLCTTDEGEFYLDDATVEYEAGNAESFRLIVNDGSSQLKAAKIAIFYHHTKHIWMYCDMRYFKDQNRYYRITYKNFSAYAKDWLVEHGYFNGVGDVPKGYR